MSDIAIRVENLGKQYRIGGAREHHDTLRDALVHVIHNSLGRNGQNGDDSVVWALRDVSFEVKRGEVMGVIGRNGAGKSTLLKILSRITEPTEGLADLYGRVGSLLEVGTGFHPELTGRENIYLSGAILGMRKAEIDRRFDEIVAFAEIEKFLDTPVKRYSSGMYVRLAFAVAAHLEPEILLVDEVLAVGDAQFQKKCLGKMGDVAREGRTVLFVSHNMGTISSLTGRCMYLKNGNLDLLGDTARVVGKYFTDNMEYRDLGMHADLDFYRRDRGMSSPIRFSHIRVNESSQNLPVIAVGSDFTIRAEVEVERAIEGAHMDVKIRNRQGNCAVMLVSKDSDFPISLGAGRHLIEIHVDRLPLTPGVYFGDFGINQAETATRAYEVILDLPLLEVMNDGQVVYWPERPWGAIHWNGVRWRAIPGYAEGSKVTSADSEG